MFILILKAVTVFDLGFMNDKNHSEYQKSVTHFDKMKVFVIARISVFHSRLHTLAVKSLSQFQTQIFSTAFHRTLIDVFLTNSKYFFHIISPATSRSFRAQSLRTLTQKVCFWRKPTQLLHLKAHLDCLGFSD